MRRGFLFQQHILKPMPSEKQEFIFPKQDETIPVS
jgi:hypothetical protein